MRALIFCPASGAESACGQLLIARGYDVHVTSSKEDVLLFLAPGESDLLIVEGISTESLDVCRAVRGTSGGENQMILAVVGQEDDMSRVIEAGVDDFVSATASSEYMEAWLALVEKRAVRRVHHTRAAENLLRAEARSRAILETTVDGVITIDEMGLITSFNPAAVRIFQYEADEVIGQNVKILMPPPFHEEHDGYLQNYHDTGRRGIIGIGREVVGQRKNGDLFPMDLAVSEVTPGDGTRHFAGLVRDISDRRRMELEILRISDDERRRIGQDLHDGLGQMLTGLGLITQNLHKRMAARDLPEAEDVGEVSELIKEADQFARGLARGLVPVDLSEAGLATAIARLADNAEKLFGIRVPFDLVGTVAVLDPTVATHLFRIAQEALSNAVKHGKARHVKISLAAGARQVRLRIYDDGVGFPDEASSEPTGMGVRIMRHRARVIGANLDIGGNAEGGTTITCTVRNINQPSPMGGQEYAKDVL